MRTAIALVFILLLSLAATAQEGSGFESTWRFPDSKALGQTLKGTLPSTQTGASGFTPGPPSGVAESLARALAPRPSDQQELLRTINELRDVYDKSALEEGRTNNLAAALTFFIASNMTAYTSKEPTEAANDSLFLQLEAAIAATPQVANLSDADKQEMLDWLVSMAGISLVTYVSADVSRNAEAVESARQLSASSLRLVLDIDPEAMTLDENGLTVIADF